MLGNDRVDEMALDALVAPDPRTLGFGPLGLGGQLPAQIALDHQKSVVTRFPLAPDVGEQTRRAVGRLQQAHLYGLLCYELFSITETQSWLVLDLALAERFLEFYGGKAPFILGNG